MGIEKGERLGWVGVEGGFIWFGMKGETRSLCHCAPNALCKGIFA